MAVADRDGWAARERRGGAWGGAGGGRIRMRVGPIYMLKPEVRAFSRYETAKVLTAPRPRRIIGAEVRE